MTENELTGLLLKLADLGVTGIKVDYDGAGDSGAIGSIGYTKERCETPEDVNDKIDSYHNDLDLVDLDYELFAKIESFAENTLLSNIENWWDQEGGYGELCICVPSGKYIINNHVRIIETEDYFHDGNLLEKTED